MSNEEKEARVIEILLYNSDDYDLYYNDELMDKNNYDY